MIWIGKLSIAVKVKLLSYCTNWPNYDIFKPMGVKNENLRKWPSKFCITLLNYQCHSSIVTRNVSFNVHNHVQQTRLVRGLAKTKIRDYYGSGWVDLGFTRIFFLENLPKIALNQYWYFGVVYHVYSVCIYIAKSCWILWFECSVHVSDGFPSLDGGYVGGWALSKFIFNFC